MEREHWTMASFALKIKSKCLNVAYKDLSDPATVHLFNNVITDLRSSAYFIPSALPSLACYSLIILPISVYTYPLSESLL